MNRESIKNLQYRLRKVLNISLLIDGDYVPRQDIPEPRIVYIDSSKNIVVNSLVDTSKYQTAQLYQYSLEDENLTLYYSSVVDGELLQNKLDYKMKIPTRITKTIEIFKPYPVSVSSILLTGGVVGNVNQFSSVRLGLEFVSAKGWALGYDYDLLENTHNINLGIKLFQFKSKKQ